MRFFKNKQILPENVWTAIIFAATPLTAFYLMQLACGGYFWQLAPSVVMANYICIGMVTVERCVD